MRRFYYEVGRSPDSRLGVLLWPNMATVSAFARVCPFPILSDRNVGEMYEKCSRNGKAENSIPVPCFGTVSLKKAAGLRSSRPTLAPLGESCSVLPSHLTLDACVGLDI